MSSSRWRWSSSSSRARTRSGTSTGSTSAPAGTSTSASTLTTCATSSTRRRSSATTPQRTVDIEYRFRFQGSEWGELEGIANRTDFDLQTHAKHSGQDLSYFDQAANERYYPYVIEPAAGLSRSLMTFLVDAYHEDEAPNTKGGVDKRVVLQLDPRLAPVKVAVLPLSRNADLSPKARDLATELRRELERRLRRLGRDRPPLPPPGRDRYAVLRDRRLRDARRQRGHGPLPRHDGAGAGAARRASRRTSPSVSSVADAVCPAQWPGAAQDGPACAAVVLIASAALLAGCSGDDEDPDAAASGSRQRLRRRTSRRRASRRRRTLPVPEGVELSPEGSQLEVGDTATVAYELRQGVVGVLDIKVTRLEKTSFKKSFVGWDLDAEPEEVQPLLRAAPRSPTAATTDLGGKQVPLYIVDGTNTLVEADHLRQRVPAVRARLVPEEVQARPEDEGLPGLPRRPRRAT